MEDNYNQKIKTISSYSKGPDFETINLINFEMSPFATPIPIKSILK